MKYPHRIIQQDKSRHPPVLFQTNQKMVPAIYVNIRTAITNFDGNSLDVFKLPFEIPESAQKMNQKDPILMMGSCFADEIGKKMAESRLTVLSNPFGTVYNPHSIFRLLQNQLEEADVVKSQEVYFHWDTHGQIAGITRSELLDLVALKRELTQSFLKKTKWLIITPGTSLVYVLPNDQIVANCHKVPGSSFRRRFLTQDEIMTGFQNLFHYLNKINPDIQTIFTISPVRHIKDGLVENNRSKAILIDAIHKIVESYEKVSYFPSYEIAIDELRDYRFYRRDMIHPNNEAVDYIWDRFREQWFDSGSLEFFRKWDKIKTALSHRPLHSHAPSHQKFLKQTLQKLEDLNDSVDLSVEIESIKSRIS